MPEEERLFPYTKRKNQQRKAVKGNNKTAEKENLARHSAKKSPKVLQK